MKTKLLVFLILISTFIILNPLKAQMYWNHACQFAGTSDSYVAVANSSSINITASFINLFMHPEFPVLLTLLAFPEFPANLNNTFLQV